MNILKLFAGSLLLSSLLEYGLYAQAKQDPCPKNNAPEIWIKDKSNGKYREGVGRKFIDIQSGELIYCVGDYIAKDNLNNIEEIRFAPPGVNPINSLIAPAGPSSAPVIPDQAAVVQAYIYSPTNFQHPTLTGKVTLEVVLYENGTIGPIRVLRFDHPVLKEIAEAEAKKLKFAPGIKDGNWVSVIKQVEFTFSAPPANLNTAELQSRPRSVGVSSFKVLQPEKGLSVKRGDVTLQWQSVPDAFGYRIEVLCNYSLDECHSDRVPGSQTSYDLKFLGDGPVRWRVVAERKNGPNTVSDWGFFGYKK